MNCPECKEQLTEYVEGLLDRAAAGRIEAHAAQCPECHGALDEMRALAQRLSDDATTSGDAALEAPVMDEILRRQSLALRRIRMRKRIRLIGLGTGGVSAAAAGLLMVLWLAWTPDNRVEAAEILAKSAQATANLRSIHIQLRMRTLPQDNFSMISLKHDLVPVTLWRQFGDKPKWRVEKPQRVAVMDGESTVMLVRSKYGVKAPAHAGFDTNWVRNLGDVDRIIDRELRSALARSWDMKLTHDRAPDGSRRIVVTVDAKAPLGTDDYLKNKFLGTADIRRVYSFDARTKRIKGLKAYVPTVDGDVLVYEITYIAYDPRIDPSIFRLKIPKDVIWHEKPRVLPDNQKYEAMTSAEAARAFFEACAGEDWEEAGKFGGSWLNNKDASLKSS